MNPFNQPDRTFGAMQGGFAAIGAVFVVVVLAALGAFMVTISTTQQISSAQDIQGQKAYWAARGGLEYAVGTVVSTNACPASSPALLTLNTFSVCVTCTASTYTEAGSSTKLYRLNAIARSVPLSSCASLSAVDAAVGKPGFIERSVSATIER